jgi:hypothetical protein
MERQSFKPNNPEQREQMIAARRKTADEILAYMNAASAGDMRRAVWILNSALQAKMLWPRGSYFGRNWYSVPDQLVFVKPTGNQPYRQRDLCCSARFLFLLCESLDVMSIDAH